MSRDELTKRDADSIRQQLAAGVAAAARYAPALEDNSIEFLPVQSVRRFSWRAQDELTQLEFVHDVRQQAFDASEDLRRGTFETIAPPSPELLVQADRLVDRIRAIPDDQRRDGQALRRMHRIAAEHHDPALLDYFLSHAWLANRLDLYPVVGSVQGFSGEMSGATPSIHAGVADLVANFDIPGPDRLTMDEIVNLRRNEESFYEFRRSYEQALLGVLERASHSQSSVNREFIHAMKENLTERQQRILSARRRSVTLEQGLTIPFTLSAVAIEHAITQAVPVGSMLTTIAATLAIVLGVVIQGRETEGDRAHRIALSSLIQV